MSSMAGWTYVNELTIWPVTFDEFSQPVFGSPYLIMGDWMQGGQSQSDNNGDEFAPSSTYYFEAADGSNLIPKPQDYILRGDYTSEIDPEMLNAEKIKKVGGWSAKAFGDSELPDWVIYT